VCCSELYTYDIFQERRRYTRMLQGVVVQCSVLQCVVVFCSVFQCVAVCLVFCSVLQCVAACCSVLQCVAVSCTLIISSKSAVNMRVCCSVL